MSIEDAQAAAPSIETGAIEGAHAMVQTDVASLHAVLVFDGVCVLCDGWVRLLLRHDRSARYAFAAMQGEAGRGLLRAHGLDPDDPVSLLLVEYDLPGGERISIDSDAIRRALAGMGGIWRCAHALVLLPKFVRDPLYRWLARNRYRWFGKHAACAVPAPEDRHRFI